MHGQDTNVVATLLLYGIPSLIIVVVYLIWRAGHKAGSAISTGYMQKVVSYRSDGFDKVIDQVKYEERKL